jgi:hypothetical protein
MSSIDDVKRAIIEEKKQRELETGSFRRIYFEGSIELGIFNNYKLSDVSLKYYKYTSYNNSHSYTKDSDIIIT